MRIHAFICGALLCAVPALAHIELDEPLVRHDNGDNGDNAAGEINKNGPCGLGGAGDVRNPSRVTTLSAGSQLTVTWRETIGHTGRMRIAFSPDGGTQASFDANVIVDIPDPAGSIGNTGLDRLWQSVITLPSTACTNCALQVVQAMTGDTNTPITTPNGSTTYFQCADLILVAGEGEGEGEPAGEGEGEIGEGEGEPAGEGEGEPAEGEGEPAGEGEGEPGEGEGELGEGEGEPGEGEGERGEGEGEGERAEGEGEPGEGEGEPAGDDDDSATLFACASSGRGSAGLVVIGLALVGRVARRRARR